MTARPPCAAGVAGVLFTPLSNCVVLTLQSHMLEWRLVFWISAGVVLVTNVLYCLLGTATVQPWNDLKALNDEEAVKWKSTTGKPHSTLHSAVFFKFNDFALNIKNVDKIQYCWLHSKFTTVSNPK